MLRIIQILKLPGQYKVTLPSFLSVHFFFVYFIPPSHFLNQSCSIVGLGERYISAVTEILKEEFYSNITNFFSKIEKAVYSLAICFIVVFTGCYLVVFIRFISMLNNEIWQTQGMVGMIPQFVLKENAKVRESVCRHRGIK